jgi:hypothetical protein
MEYVAISASRTFSNMGRADQKKIAYKLKFKPFDNIVTDRPKSCVPLQWNTDGATSNCGY